MRIVRTIVFTWVAVLLGGMLPPVTASFAAGQERTARFPVGVYVNVDEMHALWPHRDEKTGLFPKKGEPGFEEYKAQWQALINQAFGEIRKRVPRNLPLFPATSKDQPFALKISFWVADMPVSCGANTFYKYFWVTTKQVDPTYTTNWDGLGVKSDRLISLEMDQETQNANDLLSWVELWSKVPYLHVMKSGQDYTPIPQQAGDATPEGG